MRLDRQQPSRRREALPAEDRRHYVKAASEPHQQSDDFDSSHDCASERELALASVVREGFESVSLTTNSTNDLQQTLILGEADSEAVFSDSRLEAIVEAWPSLSEAVRAVIVAMIQATDQA